MTYESSLGEEKAIRLGLEGRINHFFLLFFAYLRKLVHILPLVGALWYAEGEVEFELRKDLSAEEVLFDQSQLLKRQLPVYIRKFEIQL